MKETLQTVRLLHQILIALCAAVFAFVLSPDQTAQYQSALDEVHSLQDVPFENFVSFVFERVSENLMSEQGSEYKQFAQSVTNIPLDDHFEVTPSIYCQWPKAESTLAECRAFFERRNVITYSDAAIDDPKARARIKELVQKELPTDAVAQLQTIRITFPDTVARADLRDTILQECVLANPPNWGSLAAVQFSFSVDHRFVDAPSHTEPYASTRRHTTESMYAFQWLQSLHEFSILVRTEGDKAVIFPELQNIWDSVSSMTLGQAAKFLQDKIDSPKREMSFLGISVDATIVLWAAPLVTLAFFAYFLVHVQHLRLIEKKTDTQLREFPWIALFPDWISRAVTIISIAVLPIFSNAALLYRAHQWKDTAGLVSIVVVACIAVCSMLTLLEINRIGQNRRARARDANPPKSP